MRRAGEEIRHVRTIPSVLRSRAAPAPQVTCYLLPRWRVFQVIFHYI